MVDCPFCGAEMEPGELSIWKGATWKPQGGGDLEGMMPGIVTAYRCADCRVISLRYDPPGNNDPAASRIEHLRSIGGGSEDSEDEEEDDEPRRGTTKNLCNSCYNLVDDELQICPHCGASMDVKSRE